MVRRHPRRIAEQRLQAHPEASSIFGREGGKTLIFNVNSARYEVTQRSRRAPPGRDGAPTQRSIAMKTLKALTVLFVFAVAAACLAADLKPVVLADGYRHNRFDTQPGDIVREFRAYTTSFDSADDNDGDGSGDNWGIPEWVSYELRKKPDGLGSNPQGRPSSWITDDVLHTAEVAPNDASYKHSGLSRGHMCMRSHAWRLGADADWNTHTVLNACPQQQRMNGGAWLALENKTGAWADKYDAVWIICGPVIFNGKPSSWIGDDGEVPVAVPDAFFKIVVKDAFNGGLDVLAFIFPMEGGDDYGSSNADITPYLTSVDVIEALTGLDFLTNVDDDVETQVEKITATELWEE
jgi:endonuclease G